MIKILTQNGIENTNLDGARDGYFNSGGKDGISSGILNNGTLTAQGNVLTLDTCEMRIKGHRIVIDEPITKTISGFPTVDTNYQFIAKITYNDGSVTFDTEARPTTSLIQDDILNGNGTYEVVIGEFIHKTDGTIANLVPIMRVIFGGSGVPNGGTTGQVLKKKTDADGDYEWGDGVDGTTFTPSVSEDGIISWTNDGGKENPAPVNIKGPKGDSGVASGTVNSNTEGTSDTDGYTQQAVNKIASRPNLLINPDFAINQRGQESYTGADYGVDRWKNTSGTLELQSNGEIKHTSSSTWQGIFQYIENPSRLAGKTVTISAMGRVEGATAFRIYLYYQIGTNARETVCQTSTTSTTNTIISASGTIPANITDSDKLFIMLYNETANTSFYCKWAKLEIGSVATEFSPPSIAEELPKCQRYFLIRRGYSRALSQYSLYQAYIGFGTQMRIAPTPKVYAVNGSGERVGAEKTVFNLTTKEIVDIARNPQYPTSYGCLINSSGALVQNNEYMFDIECDAEI